MSHHIWALAECIPSHQMYRGCDDISGQTRLWLISRYLIRPHWDGAGWSNTNISNVKLNTCRLKTNQLKKHSLNLSWHTMVICLNVNTNIHFNATGETQPPLYAPSLVFHSKRNEDKNEWSKHWTIRAPFPSIELIRNRFGDRPAPLPPDGGEIDRHIPFGDTDTSDVSVSRDTDTSDVSNWIFW